MDDPYTLRILDPWSLMYGEYEEDFIEVLRQKIGPKHPLYNREVYANWYDDIIRERLDKVRDENQKGKTDQ